MPPQGTCGVHTLPGTECIYDKFTYCAVIPLLRCTQDVYALGNCNPVVSLDPSTGIFTASPIHLGFRLHVNKSYTALAATPGQLDAFIASTREALAIAFKGPLTLGLDMPSETEVYIRSTFASAWPNATQGKCWTRPLSGETLSFCTPHPLIACVPSIIITLLYLPLQAKESTM